MAAALSTRSIALSGRNLGEGLQGENKVGASLSEHSTGTTNRVSKRHPPEGRICDRAETRNPRPHNTHKTTPVWQVAVAQVRRRRERRIRDANAVVRLVPADALEFTRRVVVIKRGCVLIYIGCKSKRLLHMIMHASAVCMHVAVSRRTCGAGRAGWRSSRRQTAAQRAPAMRDDHALVMWI